MLAPLKSAPRERFLSVGKKQPAPVEGWDAISPLSAMDEKRAIVLDNWFPQPGYIEVRKGHISHATGMGSTTPIQSLMAYNGLTVASNKLFGAAGGTIYDVTAAAAGSATSIVGQTNNRWQHVNYTTSANAAYLWAVNGADAPVHYNGSVWANPSITGVTSTDIIHVNVHKSRIWGVLNGSMDACYLGTDSIAGAMTKFPLGSVMKKGGYLVAMGTWTKDGGSGDDDFAVFISSKGQVAVYAGVNPASDFLLVGVYDLAPPIGRRCFTKVAGDLAIVTQDGVLPLSKALTQDRGANAAIAITARINNAMNAAAQSYRGNFGWELTPFHIGTAAILNVPIAENATAYQYVMNTLTGAWCRFLGWNANCFAEYNDNLYFGGNTGIVYKAWTGSIDVATAITAVCQTAYNYFGQGGVDKRFHSLQLLLTADATQVPAIGISTDFKDNASVATPTTATTNSALYDIAIYDTDVYAIEGRTSADWTTIRGIGQCAAVHCHASTQVSGYVQIRLNGFHIVYERGGFY